MVSRKSKKKKKKKEKKKKRRKKKINFSYLGKQTWYMYWEKCGYFQLEWSRNSAPREGQKIPCGFKQAGKRAEDRLSHDAAHKIFH